jgi:hypothetical protein
MSINTSFTPRLHLDSAITQSFSTMRDHPRGDAPMVELVGYICFIATNCGCPSRTDLVEQMLGLLLLWIDTFALSSFFRIEGGVKEVAVAIAIACNRLVSPLQSIRQPPELHHHHHHLLTPTLQTSTTLLTNSKTKPLSNSAT